MTTDSGEMKFLRQISLMLRLLGYRALGYEFEKALGENFEPSMRLKTSHEKHIGANDSSGLSTSKADVFIRPERSIGEDGNTVNVDKEMAKLFQNQILYRSSSELLNRKIGLLKYAISEGGR